MVTVQTKEKSYATAERQRRSGERSKKALGGEREKGVSTEKIKKRKQNCIKNALCD